VERNALMLEVIQQNWPAAAIVLAVAVVLLWWVLSRSGADRRERYRAPDALDEGAAPAQRNQALIDAPSAAQVAATTAAAGLAGTGPDIVGGIGEVIAPAAAQEAVTAATAASGDDLTRIKGLGPKLSARLRELGVTSFAQIAAWDDAELARIDGQLGTFAGRPARDAWVEQARFLASGDVAGYEAKFGKL
jgi:predicted flap endonuclease-1-like 5' DNA nuclease